MHTYAVYDSCTKENSVKIHSCKQNITITYTI